MSEQISCGEYPRAAFWYPQRRWFLSSRLPNQDVGLLPLTEPVGTGRTDADWFHRGLAAWSWPGYVPAPLYVPSISGCVSNPSQKITKWRLSMDVAHFSPSEISLSIREGFLEVRGKHQERPDEHGFIARCFARKYRLPVEVDVNTITSTLSVDGILTVEAPVPESCLPASINIPIKVEMEGSGGGEVNPEGEEVLQREPDDCNNSEEPPSEGQGDQDQSAAAWLQQHEERTEKEEKKEEEEETSDNPAGERHPSAPTEDEDSLRESFSEHHEGQDTSNDPELKDPVQDGEIQVMEDSAEAAEEEVTQPEEREPGQRKEQEEADIRDEHTE